MASLRAELTGKPDAGKPEPKKTAEVAKPAPPKVPEIDARPEDAAKFGNRTMVYAVMLAVFWMAASAAFFLGYFGPAGLGGLGAHVVAFAAALTFAPPFLFVAGAYAMMRAEAMEDAARQLALVSERLTVADTTAVKSAQQLGRAVRRELDALSTGLDGALGRLRALETAVQERVAQLEEAGARAGVRTEAIAQRLREERQGIEKLAETLDQAASRASETLAARNAQLIETLAQRLKDERQGLESLAATIDQTATRGSEALAGRSSQLTESLAQRLRDERVSLETLAQNLDQTAARAAESVSGRGAQLSEVLSQRLQEERDQAETLAQRLETAALGAAEILTGRSSQLAEILEQRLRKEREQIEALAATLEETSARASEGLAGRSAQLADVLAQRLREEREQIERLAETLDQTAARAAETLAGRGAQLRALIESASGDLKSAGQVLEVQSTQFREAAEKAAAAPQAAALELDRQAQHIESAADTAVARAEFVLARQERQRTAMLELLTRLKEESATFDAALEAQRKAAEQVIAQIGSQAEKLDEVAAQGLKRADAAIAEAATRAAQITHGFSKEADRVKEESEVAASAIVKLVDSLREATESAKALVAESTADAKRRSKDFVGEAMDQCDHLLRAATNVAEEAEKARASLTRAAEDAERHIIALPGIAAQEAERVRETLRSETEKMLDMSARALATLQARSGLRPAPLSAPDVTHVEAPQAPAVEPPSEGLRGLARRMTSAKRKPEEPRPRSNYALSAVLAAAEANDARTPGLRSGATAALSALQAALTDLAVDLDSAMSESENPALWRRYIDGDRGVFARRFADSIGPETVDRITALYRDNPRFHEAADAYLQEFESLLARAREGDREGLLASTLLSADTGKIYLVMAYALGRLQ